MTGQVDGFEYSPLLPINFFCSSYSFEQHVVRVKIPRPSSQIKGNRAYLKPISNGNRIAIMVKVMLEEGNNVEDDGIINTRTKVEVSFVGYGIFLIRLIVQKSSRGR